MEHPWADLEAAWEHHRRLLREAEEGRLLAPLRRPWRERLACALLLLAERLAPGVVGEGAAWAEEAWGGLRGREKARPGDA